MKFSLKNKKLISIAILIIFSLLAMASEEGGDKSTMAWTMAEGFMERKLKAPSTAKFASYSDTKIVNLGDGEYKVTSYVDAQNGFGAQVRTHYEMIVRDNGDKTWNELSIRTW